MIKDDPFLFGEGEPVQGANAPAEFTVSELSQKLKRMVEGEFSYVRVRGELSKVTVAKSGHLYTALKDDSAVLDSICWKGTLSRLNVKPEEGAEVICTGRLTTYPGRSNYQLIIETMELAGVGALLKMLEDRRKKLAAEGLFDEGRKKPIPFLPELIGVITSPTGAVIQDIMHRLNERFPRKVLIWPVMVQGAGAAEQVTKAIIGFNALPVGSPYRPDLLIVARGGGSLEDLMPFNDEALVRAVAASDIPLISAVGHETDTTLIDYAADLRAPTPTAAAEKAVPVLRDLLAWLQDTGQLLLKSTLRGIDFRRARLDGFARGLGDPVRLVETALQRLDHLALRLDQSLVNFIARKTSLLRETSAKLTPKPLLRHITVSGEALLNLGARLIRAEGQVLKDRAVRLENLQGLLQSLSFERTLERGFALVVDGAGSVIKTAAGARKKSGEAVTLKFADGAVDAKIDNTDPHKT